MKTEFADPLIESQPSEFNQLRNDEKCRGEEREGERS